MALIASVLARVAGSFFSISASAVLTAGCAARRTMVSAMS
jgi:hypothetical protein